MISMILPQVGFNADIPLYYAYGTGEPRPENWECTREYSRFRLSRCEYGYGIDWDDPPEAYLLDGVLRDKETEAEINKWVLETMEETGNQGVLYTAVNGYMDVAVGAWATDTYYYSGNTQVAVWNLKTGERITRFSDLFYEGTDFVPAMTAAENNYYFYHGSGHDIYTKEPKNFSGFTLGVLDPRFDFSMYGDGAYYSGFSAADLLYEVMDYMPAWFYFDMTPLFESNVESLPGYVSLETRTLDEYKLYKELDGNLLLGKLNPSRFLTDDETNNRNRELDELYKIIINSVEYENYEPPISEDWSTMPELFKRYDFPDGRFDPDNFFELNKYFIYEQGILPTPTAPVFTEDGEKLIIDTPFGTFFKNRETGEIFTPTDDIMLTVKEDFAGLVDIDFDGSAEWISFDGDLRIRGKNYNLRVPLEDIDTAFGGETFGVFSAWEVTKNTQTNEIGGAFYYFNDDEGYIYTKTSYVIENGKMRLTKNDKVTSERFTSPIKYFDINEKNTEKIIYGARWLIQDDIAFSGGSAKKHFDELQKSLKNLRETDHDCLTVVAEISDDKTFIFGFTQSEDGGKYYENDSAAIDFSYDIIGIKTENSGYSYSPETYIVFGEAEISDDGKMLKIEDGEIIYSED
jgi:hypothetical protein